MRRKQNPYMGATSGPSGAASVLRAPGPTWGGGKVYCHGEKNWARSAERERGRGGVRVERVIRQEGLLTRRKRRSSKEKCTCEGEEQRTRIDTFPLPLQVVLTLLQTHVVMDAEQKI